MGFEPYSSPLWAREEYVRVVYNPVDGQYKASVKIAWDAQHPGVRAVTVARPGAAVVQNSAVQPIQDAGQASPGSGVPRAGRIRVKGQPRLPAPPRRRDPGRASTRVAVTLLSDGRPGRRGEPVSAWNCWSRRADSNRRPADYELASSGRRAL